MARGKNTCRILKDIRRQIAEANDIEFVTSECRYQGDCLGTCPKCEAEVRYLEQQLRARSLAGKAVALAGISAGLIFMPSCSSSSSDKSTNANPSDSELVITDLDDDFEMGEVMEIEDSVSENIPSAPDENGDKYPILVMGEVDDEEIVAPEEVYNGEVMIDPNIRVEHWISDSTDVKPQFPGGIEAMERFITEQYRKESETKFSVGWIDFCIDRDGKVIDKNARGRFSVQLFKIMGEFPDFIPAEKDGQKVPVSLSVSLLGLGENDEIKISRIYYSIEE